MEGLQTQQHDATGVDCVFHRLENFHDENFMITIASTPLHQIMRLVLRAQGTQSVALFTHLRPASVAIRPVQRKHCSVLQRRSVAASVATKCDLPLHNDQLLHCCIITGGPRT